MIEAWRSVAGYEGAYEVSDLGHVRSLSGGLRKGIVLKGTPVGHGYLVVSLCKDGEVRKHYVHHLVARAFLGERPSGLDICHDNGNLLDNTPGNLRYDTHSANMRDSLAHGTHRSIAQTHCAHGHEFSDENTYRQTRATRDGNVKYRRVCKECAKRQQSEYRARRLVAA